MISDDMLREAAGEVAQAFMVSLPDPAEYDHVFSKSFEKKIKKLIQKVDHPVKYRFTRSVAAIALVVLVVITGILAVSPGARATVMNWIKEKIDSFTHYEYAEDEGNSGSQNEAQCKYILAEIPEGYFLVDEIQENEGSTYIYISASGDVMQFGYLYGCENNDLYLNSEQYDFISAIYGETTVDIYIARNENESNGIVWMDADQNILFHITAHMDQDELMALIEHVIPAE